MQHCTAKNIIILLTFAEFFYILPSYLGQNSYKQIFHQSKLSRLGQ